MPVPQEQSRRFDLNPRVVRPEAVQAVVADLQGLQPDGYLKALRDKRIKGTHFTEIIHPEFQVFRIGALGFELPISVDDRAQYGVTVESLSSLGRDDVKVPEDQDIGWDPIESINSMRAFVASAFFEEATLQKLPTPAINDKMIDPPPAKRSQIEGAMASKPGMFLYEWEGLEERWQEENPALFQATTQLRDHLADHYAGRMLSGYGDLPETYMSKAEPEVRSTYNDYLMEYALRTYAMLTPRPPTLIEVRTVRSNS